ncbi:heterokaryon incompatibility protein-domain-containing protein [Bisporella sp. PMI_857]|nr:heterokaryon incompatibility protein-domain-containing protein [Bisporella sp. PMI_857]
MLRIGPPGSKGPSYIHDDPIPPELWGGPALLPEPQKTDISPLRNILTSLISLFWKVPRLDQNHNIVAAINPYSAGPQLPPYPRSTASRSHCCWRCQDTNLPPVDPAKLVCNVCWDLNLKCWSITITLLNVLDAARRGCGTCDMIRRAILACATEGEIQRVVGIASRHEDGTPLGIEWISLKLRAQERESGEVGSPCPWEDIPFRQLLPENTASAGTLANIQSWISHCSENHPQCKRTTQALPTRLIDVGQDGHTPRLVISKAGKTGLYICLSHCWGDNQPLKTTTKTLKAHQKGIPWRHLPKTFQDAITITRQLGIRFLWLDSLCIIQDAPLDWQVESSNMCNIYRNAYLTLAASKATSARDGLFSQLRIPDKKLSGISSRGEPFTIYARRGGVHHPHGSEYHDNIEPRSTYFPLLARAWVYQERLLSARVVHFGNQELSWECREMIACECSGIRPDDYESNPANKYYTKMHLEMPKLLHTKLVLCPEPDVPRVQIYWREIVTVYSQLKLTHTSDRLPAISGVAQEMQLYLDDAYLAGAWRKSLIPCLLWKVVNGETRSAPPPRGVPSWSWASVDCPVTFVPGAHESGVRARVLYARCEPSGADPMGDVSSGRIQIAGRMLRAKFRGGGTLYHILEIEGQDGVSEQFVEVDHEGVGVLKEEVFVLRLMIQAAIVLRAVEGERGVYRRVGVLVADLRNEFGIRGAVYGNVVEESPLEESVVEII